MPRRRGRSLLVMAMVTLTAACTGSGSGGTGGNLSGATAGPAAGATVMVADDGTPLPPGVTLTPWHQLVPGIRLRRGHAAGAFGLDGVARPQELTVVDVDLTRPGLRLVTNPPGGPDEPRRPGHQVHTTGGALTDLVTARPEVVVAINANFFWPCCAGRGSAPVGMTLFGLAADQGTVVSDPAATQLVAGCPPVAAVTDDGSVGAPALVIDRANRASFQLVSAAKPVPSDLSAAVAGGPQPDGATPPPCGPYDGYPPERPVPGPAFLRRAGSTQATPRADPPEIVAGRTFVGLTGDRHHLLLATIDGSDTAGAAFYDEASWLELLGATDGLNLDGGGSTSMVLNTAGLSDPPASPCPADGAVVLLDVPDNGGRCRERLIGTYLGVIAPR